MPICEKSLTWTFVFGIMLRPERLRRFQRIAAVWRCGISGGSRRLARYPHNYDLASGDDEPQTIRT